MMNGYTPLQQELADSVARFAREPGPDVVNALGLASLLVEEARGGSGLGLVDAVAVAEALGRHALSGAFAGACVAAPLSLAASVPIDDALVSSIADGSAQVAVAFMPSLRWQDSRIDCANLVALDGTGATHWLLLAQAGASALVDAKAPGVSSEAEPSLDATRPLTRLTFAAAPARGLNLPDNAWLRIRDAVRIVLAADAVGASQVLLDATVAYVGERQQFGRAIGSFQAVKHQLADAAVLLEPCRALVWHAARAFDTCMDDAHLLACHAKARAGDVARQVSRTAIELHGAIGFTEELGLHRPFKRCMLNRQYLGTPAQCRDEAARLQGWLL